MKQICEQCGETLIPAPARFDGESTSVGYLPHTCNSLQKKAEESRFKELWYKRNPVHETNADSGEDMFWQTAILVAKEFAEPLAGQQKTVGWGHGWDSAITVSNNICVGISDQHNNDDEGEQATTATNCAKEIRKYHGDRSYYPTEFPPPTGEPGEDQEGLWEGIIDYLKNEQHLEFVEDDEMIAHWKSKFIIHRKQQE